MVQDLATQWIQSCPCNTKTSQETEKSLQKFFSWNHRRSTAHRSETNGIAERAVRRIKEGTSAVLLQSGQDEKWWADSVECYCYLRNMNKKTPYERQFSESLRGPIIPFGSMIEYHPLSFEDLSRLHQFMLLQTLLMPLGLLRGHVHRTVLTHMRLKL